MGNLRAKDLSRIGYTNDVARSLVINTISKHFKHHSKEVLIQIFTQLIQKPEQYATDETLGKIAGLFIEQVPEVKHQSFSLLEETGVLKVYGAKVVTPDTRRQMEVAMSLPVAIQGALMPDAHIGYGLPIGGVLATDNAVIPYAVGVDIGCRMALTITDAPATCLKSQRFQLKKALEEYTHFGMDGGLDFYQEHPVLDHVLFRETELLRKLHPKAVRQIGTSGGGNHFVEFGIAELEDEQIFGLPGGCYLALLSHSGSRGLGANIARHFTAIAINTCKLPKHAQPLAWLDLRSDAGAEYWESMNLAGDYARACHERIHANVLKAAGLKALKTIDNHHNFAWKEKLADGKEVIVHRKGATPAHNGELGIIPGSMTAPAFIVSGKGEELSLFSASHGAGRMMSRRQAKESMTVSAMKKRLAAENVTLIGGSVEENPDAYKDIRQVMSAQESLVEVIGRFYPKIVRMHKE